MSSFLKYLAYGSNLHPGRLRQRVPSAHALGVVRLGAYALRFHKRGADGSAKCNAYYTGDSADYLLGVIYRIAAHERRWLDQAEHAGSGYEIEHLRVAVDGLQQDVFAYLAHPEYIDESLAPYGWYRDLVLHGARYHGLPRTYVERIRRVATRCDPDPVRAREIAGLLREGGTRLVQ